MQFVLASRADCRCGAVVVVVVVVVVMRAQASSVWRRDGVLRMC
jgi:hypothetical protein